MYLRTKTTKGHVYYQIVKGRREGGKVRQHVLCSLGPDDDVKGTLKHRTRLLAQHRRGLAMLDRIWPAAEPIPATAAKRRARLEASIAKLTRDVDAIKRFLAQHAVVGTTRAK
jgi:hypothetical protein